MNALLDKHGIVVSRFTPGRDLKTTCPKCSAGRKHKADPCLSVKVEAGTLYANCWNCGWKIIDDGGESGFSRGGHSMGGAARHQPARAGSVLRRLRYNVHA